MIFDDTPAREANETPPTGQLATQEMIGTAGIFDAISDFDSLNRISPDDPSYSMWKDFYVKLHKGDAQFVLNYARQVREGKPLDLNEFFARAVELYKTATETQISLVTNLESVGDCERELKTTMAGVLRIFEQFLQEFGQDEAASGTLLSDLRLNLLELLANAKIKALEKAETSSQTPPPAAAQPENVRKWSDLTITFISDERVRIAFSGTPAEHLNYEEMGFGDGRGGRPRAAWQALREFSGDASKPLRIDKKRAQEIRVLLSKQFSIDSHPLLFKKGLGYLTQFKICRSSSFDT